MINWFKKSINKIYPIFDFDIIDTDEKLKPDEYYLNFCCFYSNINNCYLYSYIILKNNFTLRSNVDKSNEKSINEVVLKVCIEALEQVIKCKIKDITIQNDKYEHVSMLKNSKDKKLLRLLEQFDNVIWKIVGSNDISKSYGLCDKYIENINNIEAYKKN